jgi:hypothetical protein
LRTTRLRGATGVALLCGLAFALGTAHAVPPAAPESVAPEAAAPEAAAPEAAAPEAAAPEAAAPEAAAPEADEAAGATPTRCTYRSYAWSVKTKKTVGHLRVDKPYAEVVDDERDPADRRCTVCSEDQVAVKVAGLPEIQVCRFWAGKVTEALKGIQADGGFALERLEGYRPGRTRGAVKDGLRTEWSNHSFGTAIDINAHHNAIYNGCKLAASPTRAADIAHCKRGLGGAWDPQRRPNLTIVAGGAPHKAFTAFWKWGGALPGQLKDFMHFSITGE